MGQGSRIIYIITTNEPIKKLHPAIIRDGRCKLKHEFIKLSVEEANAWLKAKNYDKLVNDEKTIAELYALIDKSPFGLQEKENPIKLGFLK